MSLVDDGEKMSKETNSFDNKSQVKEKGLMILRIFCVLLIGLGALGAVFILQYQPTAEALLLLIGAFATIGIFFLLCASFGICHFGAGEGLSQSATDSAADILDNIASAIVLTDKKGRFVYGNKAYQKLSGHILRTPEILLARDPQAANTIWRLSRAAETGQTLRETVSFEHNPFMDSLAAEDEGNNEAQNAAQTFFPDKIAGEKNACSFKIDVRPFFAGGETLGMWTITEANGKQEQQELVHNLQDAIRYFDNAPIGFLSWNNEGQIVFYNATLAHMIELNFTSTTENMTLLNVFGEKNNAKIINWEEQSSSAQHDYGSYNALLMEVEGKKGPKKLYLYRDNHHGEGLSHALLLPNDIIIANGGTSAQQKTVEDNQSANSVSRNVAAVSSQVDIENYFYHSPIALAVIKRGLHHMEVNQRFSAMFGLSAMKGQNKTPHQGAGDTAKQDIIQFFAALAEHDRDNIMDAIEAVFKKGATPAKSLDAVMPGDKNRYIRLYITPVESTGQKYDAVILSIVEITLQRALEEQMEHSQKMQAVGQLAGGIAHDFNNVLTAIIMSCDLLLGNHRSSDPSHPDIMNIKNNAERAASLVQQLLAFSRRQTLHPEVLDLTDTLADLRMLLTRLAGSAIELKIEHGQALWSIKADQAELERVMVNLVVNAHDAMKQGGKIIIRTQNITTEESRRLPYQDLEEGEYVLVEVADNGEGIPPEILEKIFEPFFTTKEVGKGTGLGLSMVYGMISQTGGHIYCRSTLGQGTVFSIYLPRFKEKNMAGTQATTTETQEIAALKDATKHMQAEQNTKQAPASNKKNRNSDNSMDLSGSANVLLVEDEDAVRMGGVKALQSRGYTVFEAASGIEALQVIDEQQGAIDLIVSDVVMPEMDGPTLLKKLQYIYPDIKFIFVSGYAQEAFTKNMPDDADFVFLAKPFSLKQLARTVKEMLEGENG